MKIGDKVRFLNEVGGGIVVGFEGNKTVIVQDESGFDIPFPIHEVIAEPLFGISACGGGL